MMSTAEQNRLRSADSTRSATQAPATLVRYTRPPYAPTIDRATSLSMPRPPAVTE